MTPSTSSDDSSSDDIDEPKFDYDCISRENFMSNETNETLFNIIRTDTITSSCLHHKFFVIGTARGRIHVFDHEGIKMARQDMCPHFKAVTCISIDEKGEYLVSCSDDKLVVYGLCNNEHNFVLMTDKPLNVVAMDPYFHRPGSGRRFVSGDDRVILYERGILGRYKSKVLQSKEQKVRTLTWHGQFIAWATDLAVQIFDVEQRSIITRIKRDNASREINLAKDPCQICWKDNKTFLIGWANTVKVCLIKERSQEVLNDVQLRELPRKYVEIISMFETDFTISGLAPFNNSLFTLSLRIDPVEVGETSAPGPSISPTDGGEPSRETTSIHSDLNSSTTSDQLSEVMIRPQLHILETFSNSYKVLSKETPKGCYVQSSSYRQSSGFKKFPYTLLSSHSDGIYLIVGSKDVISAKPRDFDDHIDWLIKRGMLKECCTFAKKHAKELTRRSVRDIETLYLKELLTKETSECYSEAAQLCASICGSSRELWIEYIEKFRQLHQLSHLLPHLPRSVDGFHLAEASYNHILNEFLRNDPVSFFKAIKEIPSCLYSIQSMTDQVIRGLANDPKNLVLNEALAELYTRMKKFEDAVNIYLDYNDKTRIFSLIRNNNLVSILRDRVDRLMQIDADETSQLLVENIESIPMKDVVERLERYKSKKYLVSYLHRLVLKDPDSCIEYHDLMVKLYAQHQRESLLNFLKLSTNYRLEEALRICKESNLIKEVVFLHGRMGDLRIALKYITESAEDFNEAIEFCKENQDPELWQDLIVYSMDKPQYIGALLKNIGTHISDPIELIDRIPNGCEIEGLMPALVKILQDYQLQISLERSCRELMAKDCFALLEKQIGCQTKGIEVKEDQLCDHCNQPLLSDSMVDTLSQSSRSGGATGVGSPTAGPKSTGLVVFGCHHVFHEDCCADSSQPVMSLAEQEELAAGEILTCRVCMLEKDYADNNLRNPL